MPEIARRALLAASAAMALVSAAPMAAGAEKKLIMFVSNETSFAPELARNAAHVDGLPFDGVAVNSAAGWTAMKRGTRLSYSNVHGQLAPIKGRLARVAHNFVTVYTDFPGDAFDDWTPVIQNFAVLARAARDAGYEGIFFDNEEYKGKVWEYPSAMRYRSRSAAQYRAQFQRRGREVMQAVLREWPAARIIHLHGPYVSDRRTPSYVTMRQVGANDNNMRGPFFVGMMEAAPAGAVIDGGEVYQYRTAADFQRSYDWRKTSFANSYLVPSTLKAQWAGRSNIAFGTYDMQWLPGYAMTPAILTSTLRNALSQADEYVWLFTEWGGPNQYLKPGGAPRRWIDAIWAARR